MLINIHKNQEYCFYQSFLGDLLENEFQIIKMAGKTLTQVLVVSIKYITICWRETEWALKGIATGSDNADVGRLKKMDGEWDIGCITPGGYNFETYMYNVDKKKMSNYGKF